MVQYNSCYVSDRIIYEEDCMPSHTSMWCHWLRSCWIAQMWFNSFKEDIHDSLPQPDLYGWTKNNDGNYVFDWECPSVQKLVLETITFLTKGCSCKKGCTSHRGGSRGGAQGALAPPPLPYTHTPTCDTHKAQTCNTASI